MRNCFYLLLALTGAFRLGAQTPIEAGYAALYNLDFDGAHADFQGWSREHPNDPIAPVSDAAVYLFAEFDRLHTLFASRPTAQQASEAAIQFGQDDDITVLTLTRLAAGEESTTSLSAPCLAPTSADS